jgi:hypothetical protein
MSVTTGEIITVIIEGEPRRATVGERPTGARSERAFFCELESDPARQWIGSTAVVLVDTEGTMWMRGWSPEIEGALRATFALTDLGEADENLLLGSVGRRAAARAARRP